MYLLTENTNFIYQVFYTFTVKQRIERLDFFLRREKHFMSVVEIPPRVHTWYGITLLINIDNTTIKKLP